MVAYHLDPWQTGGHSFAIWYISFSPDSKQELVLELVQGHFVRTKC